MMQLCPLTIIARDHNGDLDWAKTNIILSCSLLVAEALAIKLGMQVASSENHSRVVLENDSKECILHLSQPLEAPKWAIEGLVQDVFTLSTSLSISFL